jgi:hypothetical protein
MVVSLLLFACNAIAADSDAVRLRPPKLQGDDAIVYRYLIGAKDAVQHVIVKRDGGFVFDRPGRARERGERDLRFACLTSTDRRAVRALARALDATKNPCAAARSVVSPRRQRASGRARSAAG